MNSSTSSSEAGSSARADPWRGFAVTAALSALGLLVAVLALAWAVDPYDTGRSPLLGRTGVRVQGPRTAAASRGRDPSFDAAVLGNSRIQLLSPERLNARTGFHFVQLSVPGTGPREEMTILDWFVRHRAAPPRALVLAADETWCTADSALTPPNPFPFWLFSASTVEYLADLLRFDTLEELPRRIEYLLGREERARPDGYWDYDAEYHGPGFVPGSEGPALFQVRNEAIGGNSSGRYPAASALQTLAAKLPPELALVVVYPPTYAGFIPPAGTARAANDAACKAAIEAAARNHARTAVVDWRIRRPEIEEARNFIDRTHYRQPIARAIEDEIARALKALP
jgi:hypothetical protein